MIALVANPQIAADETACDPRMVIETCALTRRFGMDLALDGVDLRVPAGSVTLLSGANGAGKSTLMRLLLNLDTPTGGRAEVHGRDSRRDGPAIRANVGYMPEGTAPGNPWLKTGRWFAHRAAYYPSWDQEYARRLITALDIRTDRRVGDLSKGQARRVQFVAALAHRPDLLLLDEPTDGFDPVVRDTVLELLTAHLADTGCTMLISTHLAAEVDPLVDHLAVLHRGRLIAQGSREAIVGDIMRHEIDAPRDWQVPDSLARNMLRSERGLGRGHVLIADAPPSRVADAVSASGARLRSTGGVSLSDAILLLLQNGSRP